MLQRTRVGWQARGSSFHGIDTKIRLAVRAGQRGARPGRGRRANCPRFESNRLARVTRHNGAARSTLVPPTMAGQGQAGAPIRGIVRPVGNGRRSTRRLFPRKGRIRRIRFTPRARAVRCARGLHDPNVQGGRRGERVRQPHGNRARMTRGMGR
jgi:hypothetical protein